MDCAPSKAFDKVPHKQLQGKLEHKGGTDGAFFGCGQGLRTRSQGGGNEQMESHRALCWHP